MLESIKSHQPLSDKANSDMQISIIIEPKNLAMTIDYMIGHQIPFIVKSEVNQQPPLESTSEQHIPSPNHKPEKERIVKDKRGLSALEKIYDKYVVNGYDTPLPSIDEIAQEAGCNLNTFNLRFKNKYGKSFYQLYLEEKMKYAAKLLAKGYKCNEVSEKIGYGEKSSIKFNKMFQKHFGVTPKTYQLKHYGSRSRR